MAQAIATAQLFMLRTVPEHTLEWWQNGYNHMNSLMNLPRNQASNLLPRRFPTDALL
jgi:hypothetical protein